MSNGVVVVLGANAFARGVPLGDWQLARAFARRGRPVVFVDPPRRPGRGRFRREIREIRESARQPGITVVSPLGFGSGRFAGLTRRSTHRAVRSAVGRRHVDMVVATHPRHAVIGRIGSWPLAYWQKDRQWATGRAGSGGQSLAAWHRTLLHAADLVTGVSEAITRDNAEQGVPAHVVPNGVEIAHWSDAEPEPGLAGLASPRALFMGGLGWRVDLDLLEALPRRLPEVVFVVVGDGTAERDWPSNVVALGRRDYADLPAIVAACDVGLVPYARNAFNEASVPLKVLEYRAGGLPVVMVGVEVDFDDPHVHKVSDVDEFVRCLRSAALDPHAVPAQLGTETWEARTEELERLLQLRA